LSAQVQSLDKLTIKTGGTLKIKPGASFELNSYGVTGISNDSTGNSRSSVKLITEKAAIAYADTKGQVDSIAILQDSIIVSYNVDGDVLERDTIRVPGGGGGGGGSSLPSNQIGYGTGTGITSSADIIVNTSQKAIRSNFMTRSRPVYNVAAWGIFPGADETAEFRILLDSLHAAGGGIIEFNEGEYIFNGMINIPNDYNGSNIPKMRNQIWRGTGGHQSGNGQDATSGTVIRLGFTGSSEGRIRTHGSGNWEVDGITFKASSGTTPMIHTTLTTLNFHDMAFVGHTTGGGNLDCIILGGTTAFLVPPDSTAAMGFQGYGTHLRNIYFNKVRRGIELKTYANSVFMSELNFWNGCGGDYAVVIDAPADVNAGNVLENSLIEITAYVAGVYLGERATRCELRGVEGFDQSGPNECVVKVHPSATGNVIYAAMEGGANNYMCSIPAGNTFFAISSSDTTQLSASLRLDATQSAHFLNNQLNVWDGNDAANLGVSNSSNAYQFKYNEANTVTILAALAKASSTITDFYSPFFGTEFFRIYTSANMRLGTGASKELYIGELANPNHYFNGGILYGGYSTGTTPFKMGQGDMLAWGDSAAPNSGTSIGIRSNAAGKLQIVNSGGSLVGSLQLKTLRDSTDSPGTLNQIPISTATGWKWFTYSTPTVGFIPTYTTGGVLVAGNIKNSLNRITTSSLTDAIVTASDSLRFTATTIDMEGPVKLSGRLLGAKGSNVASASTITLGSGNFFHVTGTTTINEMTETGWTNGSQVILFFESALTITHNASSSGATPFWIEGGSNLSVSANTANTFVLDGTYWRMIN
jgi:hypothetical protein